MEGNIQWQETMRSRVTQCAFDGFWTAKRTENNVTLFPYSPPFPIWCFPASTFPALSLAPSVLPVPSLQTPPASPGTLLASPSARFPPAADPSLGSALVLLLFCWHLCHLSWDRGGHPFPAHPIASLLLCEASGRK